MNRCPLSGGGNHAVNGRVWVSAGAKLAAALDQTTPFTGTVVNVRLRQKRPCQPYAVKSSLFRKGLQKTSQHSLGASLTKIGCDLVPLDMDDDPFAKFCVRHALLGFQPAV